MVKTGGTVLKTPLWSSALGKNLGRPIVRLNPYQHLAASRLEKIVHFRHLLAVLVQALHSTKPPSFTVFIILFSAFTLSIFVSTT